MAPQVLDRELICLVLQFLEENKFNGAARSLEIESGVFFNMRYFEACVKNGEWDEVEKYLLGFMKVDDNRVSMKIFFDIRKQRYLEALDRRDHARALDILVNELKFCSTVNEKLYKEITLLLTAENFRENEQLSGYGDIMSARVGLFDMLKHLIDMNPVFRDKLQFPNFKNSTLMTLLNQSSGGLSSNGAQAYPPLPISLMGGHLPRDGAFTRPGVHGPFQPLPAALKSPPGWMANGSVPHHTVLAESLGLAFSNNAASTLKRPRTPMNNTAVEYQSADSEHALKRPRNFGISEEVNNLPVTYPGQSHARAPYSSDNLPKTVAVILNQGSAIKSMDFHPVRPTLLLVGTDIGDIAIWEIRSKERLVLKNFKVSNLGECSMKLQAALASDYTASVNRVVWSPDGTLFGVAYSKHIVQIYSHREIDGLQTNLEIDAHIGNVSDLTFCHANKQLCIITCGEDKTIKVWDVNIGRRQYTFSGHEAPVYSICPHRRGNIEFLFSTAVDGKIKAWLYDNTGSKVDYDAPGRSCTTMAYSTDGTRLFSCGTSKEGESFMVEWDESEGTIKRNYNGLGKRSIDVVQFDTTQNRYLAVGDEFQIKFWDMDNVNLLTTIGAEGGLPASPCIRFNKEGTLLAASMSENRIAVLANADGLRLLPLTENRALDASRAASLNVSKGLMIGTFAASNSAAGVNAVVAGRNAPSTNVVGHNGDSRSSLEDVKPSTADVEKCKIPKPAEINETCQLRCLKLPDGLLTTKIVRMIYTNSGNAILALAYNAVHKLWKWPKTERDPFGKATTSAEPAIWHPTNKILMTNDISDADVENSVPCFALSKNDSYVTSASGGKVSLFNMMTFKTMTTFMSPPPSPTYMAFHPRDNNKMAIGMEDSSIQIYNVRTDQVQRKLICHQKRVTGLAFSDVLSVLVSSGADAQLCVWDMDGWKKLASAFLQIPSESASSPLAPTGVQFHSDQTHFLSVHETQIAIYKAPKLELLKQWNSSRDSGGSITDATYSCDGQSVYASFEDASVRVFAGSTLEPKRQINPSAYLPPNPKSSMKVYPKVIAANPTEPNQFALGFSNGGVYVVEPLECEHSWSSASPEEKDAIAEAKPNGNE